MFHYSDQTHRQSTSILALFSTGHLLLALTSCQEKESPPLAAQNPETTQIVPDEERTSTPQKQPASFSREALQSSIQEVSFINNLILDRHHTEQTSLEHHRFFAKELLTRIEILFSAPRAEQRAVRSRIEDLLDGLARLKKLDHLHDIRHRNSQFVDDNNQKRIEGLRALWKEQPRFANIVDGIFSEHGLLNCEHLPLLFERWNSASTTTQSLTETP